jgi:predicted secreted protein
MILSFLGFIFAALSFVQVPQWDNDWTKCSVFVPDTACHWYVVNPDNTFGKGFSWITAPEYDVKALRDIAIQHEVTVEQGYQTTVELMNAESGLEYGDDYK